MIGKSRLLKELAEEVCVVSICLRDKDSSGEPPRSLLADEMLPKSSADYTKYYVKLIAAILSVTVRFFDSAQANDTKKYTEWSKHQTTIQFHTDVQKEMCSPSLPKPKSDKDPAVTQLRLALSAVQANAFFKVSGLKILLAFNEASAMLETPKDQEIPLFRFVRHAMREILDSSGVFVVLVDTTSRVANFLPTGREDRSSRALGPRGKPPIKLFAPIYEIRTFDRKVTRSPQNWDELFLSDRLCEYGVPFFSTYLNDLMVLQARLGTYPTPAWPSASGGWRLACVAPSLELGPAGLCPEPPQLWTVPSGGWTCATHALGLAKLALGSATRAWPFFGRTLVSAQTHLQHHKDEIGALDSDAAIPQLASFALRKLLCCEKIDDSLNLTDARALALLGSTIGVPLHGHAHHNVDLTASHAAHCGYLDPTRECQRSFYPSQPIYALTANDYLQKNEDKLICCIMHLASVLSQGCIEKGEVGELASRIILLCAMNKTAAEVKIEERRAADLLNNSNQSNTMPPVINTAFPSPVPASKFLETLTGLPANELPLGKIKDGHKEKLLKGMMFWNHFLHCSSTPSLGSLMEGLERGLAIQCHHQQRGFDQLLPIYLKNQVELNQANLTFCGIQVKNREKDDSLAVTQKKMTPQNAKIKTNTSNPYLGLHFSLRSKPPHGEVNNTRNPENYRLRPSGPARAPLQASLVFHGLQAFDFLSPELKAALAKLIDTRTDLISCHGADSHGGNFAKDFLLCDEQSCPPI
ncbi:hypothetical protein PTTG_28709 [Puccinia triticina 1-1 BBBD Race 1]|uniref:Uncharacterized protein n=1 Tax=Puccinia triticina (isolate 1-1 / race 1 (BBBD)) TaxID=630390 RepID=A0A180G9J4_PUCT1|nr:hypothetical protein PTTG_28709 [Puccinia triticina 1-1 BBBD Race 1]